jgi:hypothetical protein
VLLSNRNVKTGGGMEWYLKFPFCFLAIGFSTVHYYTFNTDTKSAAHTIVQKYHNAAVRKGERTTGKELLKNIFKRTGIYTALMHAYLVTARGKAYMDDMEFNPGEFLGHTITLSAIFAALHELPKYYYAAVPGWLDQINKVTIDNISHKVLMISGKPYILARSFDGIEKAGYTDGTLGTGDGEHYEFFFMLPPNVVIDGFFALEEWYNQQDQAIKDNIAFIAFRPTPDIYDSRNIFTRKVLPGIIMGLVTLSNATDEEKKRKATMVLNSFVKFLMKSKAGASGFNFFANNKPSYSRQKGTATYVGFGSINDKIKNPHIYQGSWLYFLWNDMAYPINRDKALDLQSIKNITSVEELLSIGLPIKERESSTSAVIASSEPSTSTRPKAKTSLTSEEEKKRNAKQLMQEIREGNLTLTTTASKVIKDISDLPPGSEPKHIEALERRLGIIQAHHGKTLREQLNETDEGKEALAKLENMKSNMPEIEEETVSAVSLPTKAANILEEAELLLQDIQKKVNKMNEKEKKGEILILHALISDFTSVNPLPEEQAEFQEITEKISNLLKSHPVR